MKTKLLKNNIPVWDTAIMETSLRSRMQYQPDALQQLLFGVHDENAKQRPIPDKWSVAENIAHLGRYHEVFMERMLRATHEHDPLFERYVADNDEYFLEWCKLDYDALLNKFHATRKTLNDFLFGLSDEDIRKTARHAYYGQWTITGWCEFFLLHENHHYFTILKLLPQINAAE